MKYWAQEHTRGQKRFSGTWASIFICFLPCKIYILRGQHLLAHLTAGPNSADYIQRKSMCVYKKNRYKITTIVWMIATDRAD